MSLGRHSIANLVGTLVPMLVALATIPLYLQYIGAERYGVLAVILALLGYFGFFDLGLGRAVTQRMAFLSNAKNQYRSTLLWTALIISSLLSLIGSLILWLGANYILAHLIKMSPSAQIEAERATYVLLFALPLVLSISVLVGALQARLKYYEVNGIQLAGGVLAQVLPLIVAMCGYLEIAYLLTATLAARGITLILLLYSCRIHIPLIGLPKICKSDLKHMINYGGWVSLMSVLAPLLVTVDRLIIASLGGARAVASYTVPYDLVSRVMVISGSFSSALFPRLASANEADGRSLANQASRALVAVMTPAVILGLFLAQPFLQFWVGDDFASDCKWVAEIILIGVWINAVVIPHHARFMAKDNPRNVALIFLFEIPIYITLLWAGISFFGIIGAAIAWSIRVLIDTILLLKLNNVLKNTFVSVLPSLLLIVVAFLLLLVTEGQILFKLIILISLITTSIIKDQLLLIGLYRRLLLIDK